MERCPNAPKRYQDVSYALVIVGYRWLSLVIVGNTSIGIYAFRDRGKFERVGICQNIWWNLQNAGRALVYLNRYGVTAPLHTMLLQRCI